MDDLTIWRYLMPNKFRSMLEQSALFFSAADRLDDPYEGSLSQQEFDARASACSEVVQQASSKTGEHFIKMCVMLNCWFRSARESKAMWDLYGNGSPEALCIQSTVDALKECTKNRQLFYFCKSCQTKIKCQTPTVLVENIHYYDPQRGDERPVEPGYWWRPKYTRKANWFEHENEVRALFWFGGDDQQIEPINHQHICSILGISLPDEQNLESNRQYSQFHRERLARRNIDGAFLEVDLQKLVDRIVLAPNASHRRLADVEALVKAWGFEIPIGYSCIDIPPRF
jgi:hypothetical protein